MKNKTFSVSYRHLVISLIRGKDEICKVMGLRDLAVHSRETLDRMESKSRNRTR